jgi:hypothetical protein
LESAIPGRVLSFPGADFAIPGRETAFPGRIFAFPRRNFAFVTHGLLSAGTVFCDKRRKSNKGAGVPFYDSIATYDTGLFYDDPSSPQPNRRRMSKVKLGLKNLTRDEKIDQANTIKTGMTGNANFLELLQI